MSTAEAPPFVPEQALTAPRSVYAQDLAPLATDPAAAANVPGEDSFNAALRILYRRRRIAVAVFSAAMLAGVAYLLTTTPMYEARVRLLIQPDNPNVVAYKDVVDQDRSAVEYYQTQYTILQSRTLARLTIDALKLWDYPEFAGTAPSRWARIATLIDQAGAPTGQTAGQSAFSADSATDATAQSLAITRFLTQLTIEPVKNSRLVDVRFQATDAIIAAQVANALAQTYIEQNLDIRVQAAKEASHWLEERLGEQRKKAEANEQELQQYREQNDATALEDKQNTVVQRLADLNAAVTRAKTIRIEKQMLYEQSVALQTAKAPLDTFPPVLANPPIQALKQQLAELQRQQAQLAEHLGDRHPDMVKLRSAIQAAETTLNIELEKALQIVRNDYLVAQAQERSLAAALEAQRQQTLELDRKGITYGTLQRNAASDRGVFETLLQRAKEIGIASELKSGNVRILDEADVPRKPIWPDKGRGLPVLVVVSACLALAAAFGVERLDRRIKSPDEIRLRLGLPLLGLVPMIREHLHERGRPFIGYGAPPKFVEAFGDLRAAVLLTRAVQPVRLIVITSAGPREGKTVVACNLAVALAQTGHRVLLVDADLRRPQLHKAFNQPPQPGLAESLAGSAPLRAAIRPTSVPGLSILPAGVHDGNPGALLASARFKACVHAFSEEFDLVLLDSPPVLAVGDAAVAAAQASGVVFVVNAESTRRQAALAAIERLDAMGVYLLGVVLNQVDVDGHPYYYHPYYCSEYKPYYVTVASTEVTHDSRNVGVLD